MNDCLITGLRSIELGVTNLERSARFYTEVWGLERVAENAGRRYLRATGDGHHAVCLAQTDRARLEGITLAARDASAIDALHAKANQFGGVRVLAAPHALPPSTGGGYGLAIEGPEGLRINISSEVANVVLLTGDHSRPESLTHVVLNSRDVAAQLRFFLDFLGFRLSDSTDRMEFIRCGLDHHTIALAHGDRLSLNHVAFEMRDIDGLMYGAGRLIENGHEVEWGLGRHGPGNNVFSYFIDPDGFVVEYTTEMDQIDEAYPAKDAKYWSEFPRRPCRWGVARKPSERLMQAMAGAMQSPAR
ncbi:MAG: VOC family protein [Pseudomonadota bacterium]